MNQNTKINTKFILVLIIFLLIGCSKKKVGKIIPEREESESVIINPTEDDFKKQALITLSYDDGLLNNYEYALPLHEKYHMPATFNILGKRAIIEGEHKNFMTVDMIQDSFERGVEIASHSYSHNKLTDLNDEEIHYEMSESKQVLEDIVGKGNIETIAIPHSLYDENIKEISQEYYKGMRVWEKKRNDISSLDAHELYSSIAVTNKTTFAEIKKEIDQTIKNKEWTIIMLHGIHPEKEDKYEITPDLLKEILEYINTFSSQVHNLV